MQQLYTTVSQREREWTGILWGGRGAEEFITDDLDKEVQKERKKSPLPTSHEEPRGVW
jgi:hypothetical protein